MTTNADLSVTFAGYDHERDVIPEIRTWPWKDFVTLLSEHTVTNCLPCAGKECKSKYGPAFSPGVPRAGKTRADKNIEQLCLLAFDFDSLTNAELQGVSDRFEGLESVLYSTHSHLHQGPDDNRVRIVFPMHRALTPAEYKTVHHEVRRRYGLEWQRDGERKGADLARTDLSGLYFLPSAPVGTETLFAYEPGLLLDLETLIREAPPTNAPRVNTTQEAPQSPPEPSEASTDMAVLRRLLHKYEPKGIDGESSTITRRELIRRLERELPLVKVEERGERDKSCHRVGKILAYLLPADVPEAVIVELARPSIMSMPTYENDGEADTIDARFITLKRSWHNGLQERIEQNAAYKAQRELRQGNWDQFLKRFETKSRENRTDTDPESVDAVSPEEEEQQYAGWEDELITKLDKNGVKYVVSLGFNASVILICDRFWRGRLRYNKLTKNVDVIGGTLDEYERDPTELPTTIRYWLQKNYNVDITPNDVIAALMRVAKRNSFDPLEDYLEGVEWADSKPRIDTFLEHYLGVETVDPAGRDITKHVRKVSRRFLLSAVARGLSPGCKVDTVLILEGKTGVYKSTALKILGGQFFSDAKIVIGARDSMALAGKNWIHELSELTTFNASDVEAQKAFFSSAVDQFRVAYGRTDEKFPRRAVFVGSTNNDRYFADTEGNRRYWSMRCENPFRIQELKRDRDLIWAEAVAVYKAAATCPECLAKRDQDDRCPEHRWWFNQKDNEELEAVNKFRMKAEYAEAISDFILKLEPKNRPQYFTMYEVATSVLGLAADRVNSQQGPIGRALKALGFEKTRVRDGTELSWHHMTPQRLLEAPKKVRIVWGTNPKNGDPVANHPPPEAVQ